MNLRRFSDTSADKKLFTSSYIPTLSFASDDDDYGEPEMVTDCNDDDGNDEDVGVGWDEEFFFMCTAIPSRQSGFSRGEPPASFVASRAIVGLRLVAVSGGSLLLRSLKSL